jgi:hypothetical protein
VAPEARKNFAPGVLDKEGYRTFTVRGVQVELTTRGGETFTEELRLPPDAAVDLAGETALGEFKLSLWGPRRPVVLEPEAR